MILKKYNDGGRSKYFKGNSGDCVVRAIAIAAEMDYMEVYNDLKERNLQFVENARNTKRQAKIKSSIKGKNGSPRDGNSKRIYHNYILSLGFEWVPTMKIGSGCKVHLREDELPKGRIICRLSRHLCAVIDGILNDTYDCSRNGTRCVYGYYQKIK